VEFRILGPLEVLDDGRPVALPGGRGRALLALLILHAGEVVSADRLIDELWGESPRRRRPRPSRAWCPPSASVWNRPGAEARLEPSSERSRPAMSWRPTLPASMRTCSGAWSRRRAGPWPPSGRRASGER
jgi:hypothetical protein